MEEPPYDAPDAPFGVHAFIPKFIFVILVITVGGRYFTESNSPSVALIVFATATVVFWFFQTTSSAPRAVPVASIYAFSGVCLLSEASSGIAIKQNLPILGISLLGLSTCLGELFLKRTPAGLGWLFLAGTVASLLGAASSDAGQASPMIAWFVETFDFSLGNAETATIAIRKAIHFTYFGLIAGLAWAGAIRLSGDVRRSATFAILWTASFAAFDELNQLRFSTRSGSGWDFLIDMAGAAVFVGIARFRVQRKIQSKESSTSG